MVVYRGNDTGHSCVYGNMFDDPVYLLMQYLWRSVMYIVMYIFL
jgi:hypothetical protein